MAKIKASVIEKSANNATTINIHQRIIVHIVSFLAILFNSFCNGVISIFAL
jgi:hypothetical protein